MPTHIPVVIGGQMRYEVTGDPLYKEIATFFMDIVNSSHAYATGGTSVSEFWSDPKRLAEALTTETEESCTTYNMLKVSRHLFRWTKEIVYADYYERALINGVLSIQRGRDAGVMIYMLPQGPGRSKARSYHKWGTPYDSFWCCYGTGGRAGPGLSILDVAQQHRVSTFKMTICIMVNFWEKSDYGFIVPKQSFQWKVGFNCYSDKVKMKFMEINKTLIGDYMPLMRTILIFRKNDSFCSFLSCQA